MAREQRAALSLTTREKLPLVKMMRTLSDKSAECKAAEIERDCSWKSPPSVIHALETL